MKVFLVRHGEVFNPKQIIYGKIPGYFLSEKGCQDIKNIAEKLQKNAPFELIYASPMDRTRQSAEIISSIVPSTIEVEPRITETDVGSFQGEPFTKLPADYFSDSSEKYGIESPTMVLSRMMNWFEEIRKKHVGRTLIAVSHRDPIGALVNELNKAATKKVENCFPDTAQAFEIESFGDQLNILTLHSGS
ncbi:MAG: histidine phosphatase family protein [SAR324 cluster bacterium]|nr:histidine phosphatase family protein [SAR324 cluster bacterium]